MDNDNDASSNPLSDDHLPVAGEVSDENGETDINPDISDDIDLGDADERQGVVPPRTDDDTEETDMANEEGADSFEDEESEDMRI